MNAGPGLDLLFSQLEIVILSTPSCSATWCWSNLRAMSAATYIHPYLISRRRFENPPVFVDPELMMVTDWASHAAHMKTVVTSYFLLPTSESKITWAKRPVVSLKLVLFLPYPHANVTVSFAFRSI